MIYYNQVCVWTNIVDHGYHSITVQSGGKIVVNGSAEIYAHTIFVDYNASITADGKGYPLYLGNLRKVS